MSPQSCIAHYRIVSKLGEGGMGTVYRASDTKLNRDVAIKVLPEVFSQDLGRRSATGSASWSCVRSRAENHAVNLRVPAVHSEAI